MHWSLARYLCVDGTLQGAGVEYARVLLAKARLAFRRMFELSTRSLSSCSWTVYTIWCARRGWRITQAKIVAIVMLLMAFRCITTWMPRLIIPTSSTSRTVNPLVDSSRSPFSCVLEEYCCNADSVVCRVSVRASNAGAGVVVDIFARSRPV